MKAIPIDRLVCGEVLLLGDAFVDDELRAGTTLAVIRHAGACAQCRRMLDDGMRLKERLRRAGRAVPPPPGLVGRVRRALAA